ncbi:MAG: toxic anion resistance protein [Clostridia bacterium]|nr:toxic anion resistance protein [Clostridia bacterium]MBQ5813653.1 toxic anion resistance protein [Clostridia bacterium]
MDEKNMMNEMPTLTLDPFGGAAQAQAQPEPEVEKKPVDPVALDDTLNDAEKKMVNDFAQQIDIRNSAMVLSYGAQAQQKLAGFSESALGNVRTKDLGEVGDMITDLIGELKGFDADEDDKGIFGFFKKQTNKLETLKMKYDKAEVNVEKIASMLENHQVQLFKDIAILDQMYEKNLLNFKELTMYILAGKKKLQEVRATELAELVAKAEATGKAEDAQAANDLAALCDRFEKKLHDLELTRMVSVQMGPQIRLVQNNDTLMAEKIQTTLTSTLPLWKSQMVLALGLEHSNQAMKAQREVTDMTNELLRKNAETLKMGTINVAKESERGIVDIETLKQTNNTLISTLDEVIKIQNEGRAKRREAEAELGRIEGELKQKLLEINRG